MSYCGCNSGQLATRFCVTRSFPDFMPSCTSCCCLAESPRMLGKPQAAMLGFTITFFCDSNNNTTSNTPMVFVMTVTIIDILYTTTLAKFNEWGWMESKVLVKSFTRRWMKRAETACLKCDSSPNLSQSKLSNPDQDCSHHSCRSTFLLELISIATRWNVEDKAETCFHRRPEKWSRSFSTNYSRW